jgi:hypothetical protein
VISVSLFFLLYGLVLGVFAMLFGTERRVHPAVAPHERVSEHDRAAEPSPIFNLASVAAFAFGFGLTAYLVTRFSSLPMGGRVVLAGLAGAAALGIQTVLIARWAIPSARAEHVDERFLLQGTIARATRDLTAAVTGEIEYQLDGCAYHLPARSIDASLLAAGTDVVIDRVELGVAFVESWARVEARL